MGSRRLYDFAHGNSSVFLAAPGETQHRVLRAIPHFIAINGAIEIDLTGQVNAETVNGKYVAQSADRSTSCAAPTVRLAAARSTPLPLRRAPAR